MGLAVSGLLLLLFINVMNFKRKRNEIETVVFDLLVVGTVVMVWFG